MFSGGAKEKNGVKQVNDQIVPDCLLILIRRVFFKLFPKL